VCSGSGKSVVRCRILRGARELSNCPSKIKCQHVTIPTRTPHCSQLFSMGRQQWGAAPPQKCGPARAFRLPGGRGQARCVKRRNRLVSPLESSIACADFVFHSTLGLRVIKDHLPFWSPGVFVQKPRGDLTTIVGKHKASRSNKKTFCAEFSTVTS